MTCSVSILLQHHPQRHMKIIHNLTNTAIATTKNRCLERESNSHLVSRPPLVLPIRLKMNNAFKLIDDSKNIFTIIFGYTDLFRFLT